MRNFSIRLALRKSIYPLKSEMKVEPDPSLVRDEFSVIK